MVVILGGKIIFMTTFGLVFIFPSKNRENAWWRRVWILGKRNEEFIYHNTSRSGQVWVSFHRISCIHLPNRVIQQNSVLCTWRIQVFIDFIQLQFFSPGFCPGEVLIMGRTGVLINVNSQWLKGLRIVLSFQCVLTANLMKLINYLTVQSTSW